MLVDDDVPFERAPWEGSTRGGAGDPPPDDDARPPLALIDPAGWMGTEAPPRSWKVKDYIPDRQATLLTGKGAAGKSLLSQIKCTCIAAGLPFLGLETVQTNAIYVTCEDDADELHRRQVAICAALGITLQSLSGTLFLVSLQGEMGNELATFATDGRMSVAPRYRDIVNACKQYAIGYATLDNTAHLFTGNENDRHQVASFINLCNRLAIEIDGAVVIVGHPNKAGDSYSGSTAWENQVRSRLFMEIPTNEDGDVVDADVRVLRREKVNYAQRGGELTFRWFEGSFVLPEAVPEARRYDTSENSKAFHDNDVFLTCLAKATETRRAVSHINGINYAPRIFSHMPQAKGVKETDLRAAMERLISLGRIELEVNLWKGPNRHWKVGIRAIEERANPLQEMAENLAPTPVREPLRQPAPTPGQVIENTAPTRAMRQPLYSTSKDGEPLGGVSPPDEPPGWHRDAPLDENTLDIGDWRQNPLLNPDWEDDR